MTQEELFRHIDEALMENEIIKEVKKCTTKDREAELVSRIPQQSI